MGAPENIVLKPLHGALPEQNRDIRARAWIFAFECYRKKAAPPRTARRRERIKA